MAGVRTSVPGSGYGSAYVDSLIWGGTTWDPPSGPIRVYFGQSSDFSAAKAVHGSSDVLRSGASAIAWTASEVGAFTYAMHVYERVSGLRFEIASSVAEADIVWWKTAMDGQILGMHETPSAKQVWGYFNPTITASWANLQVGGDGLNTILHELGHGLGLAHPHDGGEGTDATPFPGVTSSRSAGDLGLNQGIWTVMSYNSGWDEARHSLSYGAQGGLGAFDIAALQALYGVNTATAQGNDWYELPRANIQGTGWSCIWDTGGLDTISGARAANAVTIDLRAATLVFNDPHAGGFISQQKDVAGGFTIANTVVIENAVGGRGGDTLIGNAAANTLTGNGGADVLNGRSGADRMIGGAGNDRYYVDNVGDRVVEKSSGGAADRVYASIGFTLSAHVERLYATGSSAIDLTGNTRDNRVYGNSGANRIDGGYGDDILKGGSGKDVFVFNTKPSKKSNLDIILDFSVKYDSIWLDNKYFAKMGTGSSSKPKKLKKSYFTIDSKAEDKNDYLFYNKKSGYLSYDKDGSGSSKAVEIVKLSKNLKLKYNDFYVV